MIASFFTELAPQNRDVLAEITLLDKRLRPDRGHQLAFIYDSSAISHEVKEQVEDLRRQRDIFPHPVCQQAFGGVNAKFVELVNLYLSFRHRRFSEESQNFQNVSKD